MRAIIFGGSGFIGTHLASSLTESGAHVTIADLVPPERIHADVNFQNCDVRRPIGIPHEEPFDVVYNLAAIHRTPGHEPSEYYETNVSGAQNVTDWCEDGGEKRLVFTSSIAIYGPSEVPKSETSDPTPNSDYGRSKLIAERLHDRWYRSGEGRRLLIVRPAVVFGRGERGNFTRLARALSRGRFMYAGRDDVVKSCGYVGDLVRSIRFMEAADDENITYNFCYDNGYTIGDICHAFTSVAGFRPPRTLPRPGLALAMRTLKVVNPNDRGTLSSARVAKLTASTNIVPEELSKRGFDWATDIESGLTAWRDSTGDNTFV